MTGSAREFRGLPHALTSFIGRSDAVAKVAGLLARYRLVTVTGPGGVGKTRLADEVLKQVADRFADGVQVVELAAVQEPALVSVTVATALGLHEAAGVSIVDVLVARLARQQLLLVLDNCEHVLEAVAQFCAAVMLSADDIRILATSREPLGLPEEARYRLPPLPLPGPDAAPGAVQAEAVILFMERARQLHPDLTVEGESGATVARLVQRLDGMPLAIELAAARVEALGLAQMLDRLDDRFRLLTSTNRTVPDRQRSLAAAVAWSYQLLGDLEQRVFRRLAVFPGPFTLDAAEAVAGADAAPAVLHLVDCSLLVPPAGGPDGRSRYSMLETLRGYGLGRLDEAGEERAAEAALAQHALQVAEQAAAQMAVRDQEPAAALWLDAEDVAVHQGLAWALDNDPASALRLALALAPWWLVRGRWAQGYTLLERATAQLTPDTDRWCSAQVWLGRLAVGASDYRVVLRHANVVVEALKDGPPSADLVDGLVGRCSALRNEGQLTEASADAHTAVELARRIGHTAGEALALQELSLVESYADQGDAAVEWARQAQRLASDRIPARVARSGDAVLLWALVLAGHLDEAADLSAQVLVETKAIGDLVEHADTLFIMAMAALKNRQLAEAGTCLCQSAELAIHGGYPMRMIDILDLSGLLCAATGRYAEAITLWSAYAAQTKAAGLAIETPQEEHEHKLPLREARHALDAPQLESAESRGAAMTLAAAVEFAVMMASQATPEPAAPALQELSARERELVTLVARGATDTQIAGQLFISVSTVRSHLDRIRDKTGCRRRADLTRLALQVGLI